MARDDSYAWHLSHGSVGKCAVAIKAKFYAILVTMFTFHKLLVFRS